MKEHPITMSTEQVKAILDGRKTQTRRVVKLPYEAEVQGTYFDKETQLWYWQLYSTPTPIDPVLLKQCPHGKVGDRLYVKEAICKPCDALQKFNSDKKCCYKADYEENPSICKGTVMWYPAEKMPRWASRITLEITDIRVEKIQSISRIDIGKEGFTGNKPQYKAKHWFEGLWNSIYGENAWKENKFVWVISFKKEASCQKQN